MTAANQYALCKRKKQAIREYKAARGCLDCGDTRMPVLDLHHRDPTTKTEKGRTIQSKLRWERLNWADLAAELEKCDVLCANCHRMREFGHLA